jgi:hypothetical protein
MRQRGGALVKTLLALVFGGAVVYAVIVALNPWAMHIGGRWTPLLTWQGSGKLHTKSGVEYPLYVSFYPSSHFSHLHLDGLRPTGGLQGYGYLCTSRGVMERMELSGTIYGSWRTTEGSLMSFRVLEQRKAFDTTPSRGFFDLYGHWQGPQLAMDGRTSVGHLFRSGITIEHPSVTFDWGSYADFKSACESATNLPAH